MRDVIAGVVALFLLLVAGSLITTLAFYRKRWESKRDQ
jgi:fructose-specific phosphotransferase system IIC component